MVNKRNTIGPQLFKYLWYIGFKNIDLHILPKYQFQGIRFLLPAKEILSSAQSQALFLAPDQQVKTCVFADRYTQTIGPHYLPMQHSILRLQLPNYMFHPT